MSRRTPLLVGLAMTLLLVAWTMSNPPFSAPDEPSHYLRALGIANGSLLGPRVPYPVALSPTAAAWVAQDTRGVLVPQPLAPPGGHCLSDRPEAHGGTCVQATPVGDYPPLAYLLPALAVGASHIAVTAGWAARIASMLPNLGFILLTIALVSGGTGWSLLGLLAAITPMVLFVGSVLNPSGVETVAGLAFLAGLLALSRARVPPARWVWAAMAVSGATLVLSEHLGPVFAGLDIALLAALLGRSGSRALLVAHARPLAAVGLVLVAALALYAAYGMSAGLFHSHIDLSPLPSSLQMGLDQLGPVFRDGVGAFGALTIHLPAALYGIWSLLVLVVVGAALLTSGRRERLTMALVAAGVAGFIVLLYAGVYRSTGFELQGRQVLPLLALLPMLAGELASRSGGSAIARGERWVPGGAVAVIAVFQLGAWWTNARTAAGEPRALWFPAHPAWSPPLGWLPWTVMSVLAAAALLGAAAAMLSRRSGVAGRAIRAAGA